MLRIPSLEPHPAGAVHAAVLPLRYPDEAKEDLVRAHYNFMRHWPTSEDFQRQCDHLQVDRWNRDFLADTHDAKMDSLARQSGFNAEVELKKMAIALLQRDCAVAGLAAAGRKRRAQRTRR
jgi:hypothetical protein